MRLSVVIEWANTRRNGVPRAWRLFDTLGRQWDEVARRAYPADLPASAASFLDQLEPRAEILVASGEILTADIEAEIRARQHRLFDIQVLVAEGMEYYPLKTYAGQRATGDLLLFVDSDVGPEEGWLAHLLGTLARPEVHVVAGQTYVAPTDLVARAFALGWTYPLREGSSEIFRPRKFYANTLAFRRDAYRQTGFRPIGSRTRGAASLLRDDLERVGKPIWQNQRARVDHPPPANLRHLAVRAIAQGRDVYMARSEERTFEGLSRTLRVAVQRWSRSCRRALRDRDRVGLPLWEVPAALTITGSYYFFFALAALMCHANPRAMGRHFRV